MRLIKAGLCFALMAGFCFAATDDMLIIEQDYKILEAAARDGAPNARDIRQIMYVTSDAVCIDEYGDGGKTPTETYIIDMKNQRIVNLDNTEKKILLDESFADRRARIQKRKKDIQNSYDDIVDEKPRERFLKMYRYMLDDKRVYTFTESNNEAGNKFKKMVVKDSAEPTFSPLEATVHSSIQMPYDNSEVLYLLRIVSEGVAKFLKSNQAVFSFVPMEMHLQTPDGGKLDTKVVGVKKIKSGEFDPASRVLGDPFKIPAGYTVQQKLAPKPLPPTEDKPKKEKAD